MRTILLAFVSLTAAALAEPVSLFDGKTLEGWDFDPKIWRVEDGMITGGSTTEKIKENHFICTKKSYQNFELKLKIKCSGDPKTGMINSGIQVRSVRVPGGAHMSGYQVDCGQGWFGRIYDEFRRNKVIAEPVDAAALAKAVDIFGWNDYRIRAEGPRIQAWINGVLAIDYTEQDKNVALDGQVGPQVHSGGVCLVQFKDVTLEELPPTPGAPTWESLGGVEAARKLVAPPPKPKAQADNAKATKSGRDISYNSVQGAARTAAEQQKFFKLPEGFEIELVVQESEGLGKFVSVYFDQRGRLWTQTAFEYPVDANENPAAAEAVYQGKGKDKVLVYPREALNAPLPPGGLVNPTVFCDGLAIPLGILPWGNGDTCYVQHGHDLKLFKDTDGDGKADMHTVMLTGFGVQDSHLFPHQFTRAPGGWIWMAQGLFNNSKVTSPDGGPIVEWPMCSMARMAANGDTVGAFEVTSVGPNNIWGLVLTGEGECFIQEANDYGYPVMPFHEFAYYPGGTERIKKSYQPDFPPTAEFRMGGTGLSGLALGEGPFRNLTPTVKDDGLCMFVANPIISKVQTIAMHRDGRSWKLEQPTDLITCDDPFFRPVAMTNGPDGCIYIVDWYNKIISHNEVPRAHPDRDKTRGRIWRVKPKSIVGPASAGSIPQDPATAGTTMPIPDFTQLSDKQLIALLGEQPTARAHLAWQTLADRDDTEAAIPLLQAIIQDKSATAACRIQAQWALELHSQNMGTQILMSHDPNANVRREAVRSAATNIQWSIHEVAHEKGFKHLADDPDPTVRAELIRKLGREFDQEGGDEQLAFRLLLSMARSPVETPVGVSSRTGAPIKIGTAYDRAFERFLVRFLIERQLADDIIYRETIPRSQRTDEPPLADRIIAILDSPQGQALPVEARVLASLALEPNASASRVAKLLPQLDRAPNDEELLRLAQFPEESGVGEALTALLTHEKSRAAVAEKLLAHRTKIDDSKLRPLLDKTVKAMIRSTEPSIRRLALKLTGGFKISVVEEFVVMPLMERENLVTTGKAGGQETTDELVLRLNALRDLRSAEAQLFFALAQSDPEAAVRHAALEALIAASTNTVRSACERLFKLYPDLRPDQRKLVLNALSGQAEGGAKFLLTALLDKTVPSTDLDGPTVERLATVLGDDPDLAKLQQQLGGVFRDVLLLDGKETAWAESKITLDGPFTVEGWVRLAEGIGNQDGILGSPGQIDMNFFQSKFRVWIGEKGLHDVVVAKKPITPDLWTHVAITRDAQGTFKLYQNGELDTVGAKQTSARFENCRVGWSGAKEGTNGALCEFRVWSYERSAVEIRANFDRVVGRGSDVLPLFTFPVPGENPAVPLSKGARIAKTIDSPPLLTEEQARALDTKFAHYSALSAKPGNRENGKLLSTLCMSCHQIGNAGGQIGPNLSGAGAMGLEAVLRNILTPNAAMEPGYRTFRVEMMNGDLVDAFFVSEDKDALIVRQAGLPDRRIAKADVRSTRYIRRSLMPEGLLDALNDEQATDLLGYLMTLK